jgi:hypothetical protein
MSSDTLVIQDALGEKVLNLWIQLFLKFIFPPSTTNTSVAKPAKSRDNANIIFVLNFQQNGSMAFVFLC